MDFEFLSDISQIETIAKGPSVRDRARLRRTYGGSRWLKKKGIAHVRLADGTASLEEVHWYEAHGIGRVEFKIKR
jgi:hypothetical protein